MLLLRALVLDSLVCFHVIGAAVLFYRLFPRESPWLALILPTIGMMFTCNFVEHFIALPSLGWLLPITFVLFLFAMACRGEYRIGGITLADVSWRELRLPLVVFTLVFQWAFFLKCLYPEITCNTEGVADMARVLDFLLGDKLPPTDAWCPPYDHGGYYTFQHYGASLLTRLLTLDVGTGYNMGYTLLNTLTLVVGTGAAYVIGGRRLWVGAVALLLLLANFSGSLLFVFLHNPLHPDTRLAVDIGDAWDDPARNNIFAWIFEPLRKAYTDPPYNPPVLRLFTPAFNTYFAEFHANLGGHFMTLATLLAANEANRREQATNWPWICLLTFPMMTIITATWFLIVVVVFSVFSLAAVLFAGRRPQSWTFVLAGTAIANMLIWPSVNSLLSGSYPIPFNWTPWRDYTPFWEFVIQWWPVLIPWFLLIFVWRRLSWLARALHLAVPLLLILVEVINFSDRGLTVEKMWGAVYGAGLVTFVPLVCLERNWIFRLVTGIYILFGLIFFASWIKTSIFDPDYYSTIGFHLRGDTIMQNNPQKKRMLQVLERLHGQTVLTRGAYAYNDSPSMVDFSENRVFIAWFFQEYQCGHGGEAEYRNKLSNEFYDGKMADPLPFLRSNDIAAILIYPEDDEAICIPDDRLAKFKEQLAPDYYYIDCRDAGPHNAGVFLRFSGVRTLPVDTRPVSPSPLPSAIPAVQH